MFKSIGWYLRPEPHSGALVSWACLLLVDFLVGVGGVEPSGSLLLLSLSKRVLPQRRVDTVIVKLVEGCYSRRHLHLPPCPRSFQQHRETISVAGTIALKTTPKRYCYKIKPCTVWQNSFLALLLRFPLGLIMLHHQPHQVLESEPWGLLKNLFETLFTQPAEFLWFKLSVHITTFCATLGCCFCA